MKLSFRNRRIRGMLAVVPRHERDFLADMDAFNAPRARSLKLQQVMGYDKRRTVDGPVCTSDLAVAGMEHLFDRGLLRRDEVDALFLVTQTPDHFMPPTSSVIHGRLGLGRDVYCLDVNQGCAGFLVGLFQAFQALEQPAIRTVVLINADVLSRKVSPKDRASAPLIGDAASITLVERCDDPAPIHASLQADGSRSAALTIPAGGLRRPADAGTAVWETDPDGNERTPEHLHMDGGAVFHFVQVEVPPMIEALLADAGARIEDVDSFLFHQPNRFMLQKLADKLKLPYDKVPMNIVERYGNSSGVTIPMAIVHNLRERVTGGTLRACFAGFGVGLTWASMLAPLGPLAFCEMIEYPPEAR